MAIAYSYDKPALRLLEILGVSAEKVTEVSVLMTAHEPVKVQITRFVSEDELGAVVSAIESFQLVPKSE